MESLLWIFVLLLYNVLAGVNIYKEKPRRAKVYTHIDLKDPLRAMKLGRKLTRDINVVEKLPSDVSHFIIIVRSKCTEGKHYKTDPCNLCYCTKNTLKCTALKCTKAKAKRHKVLALKGSENKFYQRLRDAATKCTPGTHKVVTEGNDHCPCTCIIPSVAYCPQCPAVERIIIPRKNKTQYDEGV